MRRGERSIKNESSVLSSAHSTDLRNKGLIPAGRRASLLSCLQYPVPYLSPLSIQRTRRAWRRLRTVHVPLARSRPALPQRTYRRPLSPHDRCHLSPRMCSARLVQQLEPKPSLGRHSHPCSCCVPLTRPCRSSTLAVRRASAIDAMPLPLPVQCRSGGAWHGRRNLQGPILRGDPKMPL